MIDQYLDRLECSSISTINGWLTAASRNQEHLYIYLCQSEELLKAAANMAVCQEARGWNKDSVYQLAISKVLDSSEIEYKSGIASDLDKLKLEAWKKLARILRGSE